MQQITSLQNARIRELRLLQDKKSRVAAGRFLVEGVKMVEEALAHTTVRTVVVQEDRAQQHDALLAKLQERGVTVIMSPRHVLEALCETKTPQGIMAEVDIPAPVAGAMGVRLVALDGVQDPGNVGAILRTADAAGFAGALMSTPCADVYGGKALRATMGSVFRVPVARAEDLAQALLELRQVGYAILSSQLDGDDFFARSPLPEKLVLVIGSEGEGVSASVAQVATHRFRLPMRGGAESLNAAVAAGIMLYDLSRDEGRTKSCK